LASKKNVSALIEEWMAEFGAEHGYELSRTEFVKEGDSWYLRIFVDKLTEEGYDRMGTDDCEIISRFLSAQLDAADPIRQNYYLEVSSPGLDRPLLKESDYKRFSGCAVDVSLYRAFNGSKTMHGLLGERDGEQLFIIDGEGQTHCIPLSLISKVKLAIVF
jgi:ribosome maturation factor RimP